jgi:tRNA A37 threonylcarbamoyladenosine synthetase subunit TsaC/SUA5/YrdC
LATIVSLSDSGRRWRMMREGAIPQQKIEEVLGDQ